MTEIDYWMRIMKRDDETLTAHTLRLLREEERERCAKIAERTGDELQQYAVGGAIAKAIRGQP